MVESSLVRFGYGAAIRHVQATMTDRTGIIAVDLAGDKDLTKRLLSEAGLPVPRGCVVTSRTAATACLEASAPPLVVKPLDGNQGRGVSLNLMTANQLGEAFDLAHEISDVRLHMLDRHSGFDLKTRRPFRREQPSR